jgi:hypothetical protein
MQLRIMEDTKAKTNGSRHLATKMSPRKVVTSLRCPSTMTQ